MGESLEGRLSNTGRWGGKADGMAFGVSNGTSSASVAAVLGQTQLGLPPGAGAGNGTGEDIEGYASAGSNPEPGWSDYGCGKMRETAFDNDGKWKYLENRDFYAVPPKTGKLYDLNGAKPLFNKPKPAPAAGATAGNGGGGGGGGGDGGAAGGTPIARSSSSAAATGGGGGVAEAIAASGAGHKQEKKSAGVEGGSSASSDSSRRELEDGSSVRNRLVVTDGPSGGGEGSSGSEESLGSVSGRPRAEADGRDIGSSVVFDDGARRPGSVEAGAYGPGGTQVGGALLSAGGASALQSQLTGDLPKDGDQPADEEKEDESRSKKRPTEVERKPASAWDSVMNGDYFKKIFRAQEGSAGGDGGRRPRVVQ